MSRFMLKMTRTMPTIALAGAILIGAVPAPAQASTPVAEPPRNSAPAGEGAFSGAPAAKPALTYAWKTVTTKVKSSRTVTKTGLNLRKGATTKSQRIKVLKKGTTVTVKGSKSGWKRVTVSGKNGWVSAKYLTTKTTTKTVKKRVKVAVAKKTAAAATSSKYTSTVKAPPATKQEASKLPRPEQLNIELDQLTTYTLSAKSTWVAHPQMNVRQGLRVELQQWNGSRWVVKDAGVTKNWSTAVTVPTSSLARGYEYWRFYAPATATTASFAGKTWKIKRENPEAYTGYKAGLHAAIKKYCPGTTIEVIANDGKSPYAGLAWGHLNRIHVLGDVFEPRYPRATDYRNSIALHECGHIRQHLMKVKTGVKESTYLARMNKIYGGTGTLGMERNASCIAIAMGGKTGWWIGADQDCTGKKLTAAKTVLAGKMP